MSSDYRREKVTDLLLDRIEGLIDEYDKIEWPKGSFFHKVETLKKLAQAAQFAVNKPDLNA